MPGIAGSGISLRYISLASRYLYVVRSVHGRLTITGYSVSDAETTEMHAGGRWPDLRAELDNQPPLLWQREREGRANEFGVACPSASLAPGRRVAAGPVSAGFKTRSMSHS